jgi:hypothetical protein
VTDDNQLRATLEAQASHELASILSRHDLTEWRPEVFDVVRAILAARGFSVDAAELVEPPPEPSPTPGSTIAPHEGQAPPVSVIGVRSLIVG